MFILFFLTTLCFSQTKIKKNYLTAEDPNFPASWKPKLENTSPLTINGKILQFWSNLANKEKALLFDKKRKEELKKIEVGDMICAREIYIILVWNGGKYGTSYKKEFWVREIKAFVEQTAKNKIQIKVADKSDRWEQFIDTSETGHEVVAFSGEIKDIPFVSKGIELEKGNIYWIDAINDYRWYNCN